MALDDERIERYSRQLILAEVGPRGQERLLAARVAVVGTGVAAERVVAYLAAAGVGWIACAPELAACVDPATRDVMVASVADAERDGVDAAVVVSETIAGAADGVASWQPSGAPTFWIAAGRAGATTPCPRCATSATAATPAPGELAAVRDMLLATVVATETVKTLLAIGTTLRGRVLAYDPANASITTEEVTSQPGCACATAPRGD